MIGTKLGSRYEVVRELGRGGMGVVYLARDPLLDRDVAIKVIASLSPERKERFLREARVIAKMDHPGIVSVHDLGEHEDGLFFVMPFVPGTNLRHVLSQSPLKLGELIDLGVQAAEALEYSHSLGIVHRDVKPENIMVAHETGEALRIRITDFGLAVTATEQRLTSTGALIGTVSYLSPEQVGGRTVDPRVDVYALGTVLYECAAGKTPFKGEIQSVLYRIVHEQPAPLRTLTPDVDEELDALILSCLEKEPARRPQKASDVASALGRYRTKIAGSPRATITLRTVETKGAPWAAAPALGPFIGRGKELAELQARLNAAVAGESQFVLVGGEGGVGKTRLVEELERLAHARQIRTLQGNFNELGGATPYAGFIEMIEAHLRRSSATRGVSGTELADLEDELVAVFPTLAELHPGRARTGSAPRPPSPAPDREHDRIAVFDLLARALTRIAGEEPLLLLLEELHAATGSIEALQYVARRLGPTRTLTLGTFTSTDVDRSHPLTKLIDGFKGNKRFALVNVDRFTFAEHCSFLQTVSVGSPVDPVLAQKLYEASEGNPFYTRELFRSLLDAGGVEKQERGSWSLSGDANLTFDAIPATIQKAVERRVERLPDDLRRVLSMASVLGKSFEEHELEALLEEDEVDLDDALEKLVRAGFLEEQRKGRGDRLAFTSATMREVLYAEIPRRKRRSLHRRVAEHLEKKNAGRLERVRAQLVHHYTQADDADKVFEYGIELARSALAAFSGDDAIRAAKSVLTFVEDGESTEAIEVEARTLLSAAYRLNGDVDGALKEIEAAIKLREHMGDPVRLLSAYVDAADVAWEGRRVGEARRWVEKGIKTARAVGDSTTLTRLLSLGITVANLRGDAGTAREYLEESERIKPAAPAAEPGVSEGGTVRVALANPVRNAEPALLQTEEESEVLSTAFERLLATDEQGNVVPELCELWEAHEGGSRFTFTLRGDVVRHDGQKLTAAHVKQGLERTARLAADRLPLALSAIQGTRAWCDGKATELSGIEVTGETTFAIRLDEPLPIFPALLTEVRTSIALEPPPGAAAPIGTGMFRLEAMEPSRVVLARHDKHWRSRPAVLGIEYHVGLTSADIASGFRAGRYDIVRDVSPAGIEDLLRDRRLGASSVERPKKNVYYGLFNATSETSKHEALRAALAGVIAPTDLVWRHVGRLGRPAEGLIPPGILGHDPGRRRNVLTRESALELLATTGLPRPIRMRAAVHPALLDRHRSMLDAIRECWSAIGVEMTVTTHDMESFLEAIKKPDEVDVTFQRWGADYDDPDSFTYALFDSTVGQRRAFYSSPALDRSLKEARLEPSPQKRASLYRKIEEGLLAANVILPLWHDEDCRIYGPRLRGVSLRSNPPFVNYAALGVREGSQVTHARGSRGGSLLLLLNASIERLEPVLASTAEENDTLGSVFEPLMHEGAGARIMPWLASSCTSEEGGRRFRFALRDNVHFHDGRKLTARDVRYSMERLLRDGDATYKNMLAPIVGARAVTAGAARELAGLRIVSPRELVIDLETPLPFFPALLTHTSTAIVPEGSKSGAGSWREGCVGTGPFRVARFEPGRRLELEANPQYWRSGYPKSDAVTFFFGVPSSDAMARLRAGQCSLVLNPPPADAEALRQHPDLAPGYRASPMLTSYALAFNVHRGPFADETTRRTVARALDVDALIRGLGRAVTRALTFLPPGILGHDSSRTASPPTAPSQKLDLECSLLVSPAFEMRYERVKNEVIEALGGLGIRLKLAAGLPSPAHADHDLYLGRWVADYPDPDTFAYGALHSVMGFMGGYCGTPDLDARIERARSETDPVARDALYRDIEAVLSERALLVPLFHDKSLLFAQRSVRGIDHVLTTMTGIPDYGALWVEE